MELEVKWQDQSEWHANSSKYSTEVVNVVLLCMSTVQPEGCHYNSSSWVEGVKVVRAVDASGAARLSREARRPSKAAPHLLWLMVFEALHMTYANNRISGKSDLGI
jgi:hypothetical protein